MVKHKKLKYFERDSVFWSLKYHFINVTFFIMTKVIVSLKLTFYQDKRTIEDVLQNTIELDTSCQKNVSLGIVCSK